MTNLNNRQTFGYGVAGQKLATITRHLYNQDTRAGECGEIVDNSKYPLFSYYQVVTRLTKAPICESCLTAIPLD